MDWYELGGHLLTLINILMGLVTIGFAGQRLYLIRLGIERRRRVFALWLVIVLALYPVIIYMSRIVGATPDPIPAVVARPMTTALYGAVLVILVGER